MVNGPLGLPRARPGHHRRSPARTALAYELGVSPPWPPRLNVVATPGPLGLVADELREEAPMIDLFSLALSHGLLMLAAIALLRRPDLDRDLPGTPPVIGAPPPRA